MILLLYFGLLLIYAVHNQLNDSYHFNNSLIDENLPLRKCVIVGASIINSFDSGLFNLNIPTGMQCILAQSIKRLSSSSHYMNESVIEQQSTSIFNTNQNGNVKIMLNVDYPCLDFTSCNHSLVIIDDSMEIRVKPKTDANFFVTINHKRIMLPYFMDQKINTIGTYLLIELSNGVIVKWDGSYIIEILTYKKIGNYGSNLVDLIGLCGSNDGNFGNEFMDDSLKNLTTSQQMIDAWCSSQLDAVTKDRFPIVHLDDQTDILEWQCLPLNDRTFETCKTVVDVQPYVRLCKLMVSNCDTTINNDCSCLAIQLYATICSSLIKAVYSWRSLDRCSFSCPSDQEYSDCVNNNNKCSSLSNYLLPDQYSYDLSCVDGCTCPHGFYYDIIQDRCVDKSQCSCFDNNQPYPSGFALISQCRQCVCTDANWNCSLIDHCPSRCELISINQLRTLDGRMLNMFGRCSYYLLKFKNETDALNIIIQYNSDSTFDLIIEIQGKYTQNKNFKLKSTLNSLNQMKLDLEVNGITKKYVSYLGIGFIRLSEQLLIFEIYSLGIQILYMGNRMSIVVDGLMSGHDQISGLCGNFDGNSKNDLVNRHGILEFDENVSKLVESWSLTTDSTQLDSCHRMPWTINESPCVSHAGRWLIAQSICSILISSTDLFNSCHSFVNPVHYYNSCLQSVCSESKIGESSLNSHCASIEAYASVCRNNGLEINWRSSIDSCANIICPSGTEYKTCQNNNNMCANQCSIFRNFMNITCQNIGCQEGCYCTNGTYNTYEGTCVVDELCPCFHPLHGLLKVGSTFKDQCNTCECKSNGLVQCTQYDCQQQCRDKHLVYKQCGLICSNIPNELKCIEGCHCSEGLALTLNGSCVHPTDCPCIGPLNIEYPNNSFLPGDCNIICYNGKWSRADNYVSYKYLYSSECLIYGQSSYKTFDGVWYGLRKNRAQIIALRNCLGKCYPTLEIRLRHQKCQYPDMEKTICKIIFIDFLNKVSKTMVNIVLEEEKVSIMDDSSDIRMEFYPGKYPSEDNTFFFNQLRIFKAGDFIVVDIIEENVIIKFNQILSLLIGSTNDNFQANFTGLCGNFNGKDSDEFMAPNGLMMSGSGEFGSSWTIRGETVLSNDINNCENNPLSEWATEGCSKLKSDAFKPCHHIVDVTPFEEACRQETCECVTGGDCHCFCSSIQIYVFSCLLKGVRLDWRKHGFCAPTCCSSCEHNGTSYKYSDGFRIERNCSNSVCYHTKQECCDKPLVEGCRCSDNFYNDGLNCVPKEPLQCIEPSSSISPTTWLESSYFTSSFSVTPTINILNQEFSSEPSFKLFFPMESSPSYSALYTQSTNDYSFEQSSEYYSTVESSFNTFEPWLHTISFYEPLTSDTLIPQSEFLSFPQCPICYYEGLYLNPGEIVEHQESCKTAHCIVTFNSCMKISSYQIETKPLECKPCLEGYYPHHEEGKCCPTCVKNIQLINECNLMEKSMDDIEIDGCNVNAGQSIHICQGQCLNNDITHNDCSSCIAISFELITIGLTCSNSTQFSIVIKSAKDCYCGLTECFQH